MSYLTECREFFGQFRQENRNTGSILPSSRFLARALIRPLTQAVGPRRIMEVGPGTGAVTGEIVKHLRPDDRLDIVEINPRFVALMQAKLAEDPAYSKVREQVRIIHAPLQEVPGEAVCDFMISGLPLNNFPLRLVLEIFGCYQRLLKPSGVLSYFEYLAIRALKLPFVSAAERNRLRLLGRYLDTQIKRFQIGQQKVFRNIPPAVARHLRFG